LRVIGEENCSRNR